MWMRMDDSTRPPMAKPAIISRKTMRVCAGSSGAAWARAGALAGRPGASTCRRRDRPSSQAWIGRQTRSFSRGEDEVDRRASRGSRAAGGDRPEDRRGEAGDQGQMGDAALRADRPDLHDGDEGGGVEHEAEASSIATRRGDEADAFRRQGAGGERQRRGGRADRHHPPGAITVGHAAGRRRQQAAEEERQRQGAEHPLLRQAEIGRHGRREDREAVDRACRSR